MTKSKPGIAIYHRVLADDTFDDAAKALVELIHEAARRFPRSKRHLCLDIEGHRNAAGGFDHDMCELQNEFLLGILMPCLSSARLPITGGATTVNNRRQQRPPQGLTIIDNVNGKTPDLRVLKRHARESGQPVYDGQKHRLIHPDGAVDN